MTSAFLKRIARKVAGDYSIYRIYVSPEAEAIEQSSDPQADNSVERIDAESLKSQPSALIRDQAGYDGREAELFAYKNDGRIVGVCCYWSGELYRSRNFWPLKDDEAKLVQIVVEPEFRGKGVATALITRSCADMLHRGVRRCFARIWHSNEPSIRAFEKANWRRVATVVELAPFNLGKRLRFVFRARPMKQRQ